jgi:hypothetical protein
MSEMENYYYNCSPEYIRSISDNLNKEISSIISKLSKKDNQKELNIDFFVNLVEKGWSFDSIPSGLNDILNSKSSDIIKNISSIKKDNNRSLCLSTTTLGVKWCSDYAKLIDNNLVQIEVQFGKIESMFKDFCGFQIASFEKRLALGIEIVMVEPYQYFSHRKSTISGMANFEIAKNTLHAIRLKCPIWLVGLKE